ncbi:MAG: hypothetical protein AAFO77_08035 [Pseudomonadota bacterium]
MKFVLDETPMAWWPVKVEVPSPVKENAGQTETHTFQIEFIVPSREDLRQADEAVASLSDFNEREAHWDAFIYERINSWSDVQNLDGAPLTFNAVNLDRLMANGWARSAIYRAFFECVRGQGAEKN